MGHKFFKENLCLSDEWRGINHLVSLSDLSMIAGGTVQPRGLTLEEAAAYCGISGSSYHIWMNKGLVPGFWQGTRRIDRLALDAALDKMSGRGDPVANLSKFDAWKANNASA